MKNNKNNIVSKPPEPQGKMICTVCGKEFEANDNTRHIINGGFTCSWGCFNNEAKRRAAIKKEENKEDKKTRK